MASAATAARTLDVVVYGCTGFTGKLVGEYLAAHYGSEVTWAIAGRNQKKLDAAKVGSCTHNHTWGAQTPKPQQTQQAQSAPHLKGPPTRSRTQPFIHVQARFESMGAANLSTIVADASHPDSLYSLAKQTKCGITTTQHTAAL